MCEDRLKIIGCKNTCNASAKGNKSSRHKKRLSVTVKGNIHQEDRNHNF